MARTNTYLQKGQKQELSDIVKNLAPTATPFQSMIGSGKTKSKLFSWTEESLAKPGDNALIEGGDAWDGTPNILEEFQNYTQIFTKTVDLTGTSQYNQLAGNVQEVSHQVMLRAKELKNDVEYAYVGSGQVADAGNSTTARKTAGFQAQAGTTRDLEGKQLDADVLDDILLSILEEGGSPDVVMAHPRLITSLAKRLDAIRMRDMSESTKFTSKVTKYLSNAGEVEFHPNLRCKFDTTTRQGDVLVFDSSMWAEQVLRPYSVKDLAKTGDSDRKMLIVEKGLKCAAPKSAALITNVAV